MSLFKHPRTVANTFTTEKGQFVVGVQFSNQLETEIATLTTERDSLLKDKERLEMVIAHGGCVIRNEDEEIELEVNGEIWEFYAELKALPIGKGISARAAIDNAIFDQQANEYQGEQQ